MSRRLSLHRALFLLLALATALPAAPLPSNMDLVVETLEGAVEEALAHMDAPEDAARAPLLVVPQTKHAANWLMDHILASRLLDRGFAVTLDSTVARQGGLRLSYRILDLGITGRAGLRGSQVDRQSRATLALRLSQQDDETIFWQEEFTERRQDRVPKNQISLLQNTNYTFAKTELQEETWSKFVEPMIVSTVLGGLIYLFFSNR